MAKTGPSFNKRLLAAQESDDARLDEAEDNDVEAFLVDGAITKTSGLKKLTKATAGAYTLAAPTAAEEGNRLTITSRTAAAHVITSTGKLDDGVTGGSKNTATFAAFAGASLELVAVDLKWAVVGKNLVTIA